MTAHVAAEAPEPLVARYVCLEASEQAAEANILEKLTDLLKELARASSRPATADVRYAITVDVAELPLLTSPRFIQQVMDALLAYRAYFARVGALCIRTKPGLQTALVRTTVALATLPMPVSVEETWAGEEKNLGMK